jgi:hypothetical protein
VHPQPDEVIAEVYLKTGPQAAAVAKVEQLPEGDLKARIEGWSQIVAQLPEADPGRWLARARAIELSDSDRLAAGEAVSITSLEAFRLIRGDWTVDEAGRFVGAGMAGDRAMPLYRPNVGQHYEYTGRYEILTAASVPNRAAAIVFAYAPGVPWYELYPSLDPRQAILQSTQRHRRRVPGYVPVTGYFAIRVTGQGSRGHHRWRSGNLRLGHGAGR